MKATSIYLLLLAWFICTPLAATETFMVKISEECDIHNTAVAAYTQVLEYTLRKEMKKRIPCSEVYFMSDINIWLSFKRMQQLLGTPGGEDLSAIEGALGVKYLIISNANVVGSKLAGSLTCVYMKDKSVIASGFLTAPSDNFKECAEQVADKMIKELEEYEVCPYKGPVTIDVDGSKDETTTNYDSGPCGGNVTITNTVKMNSTLKWNLNKTGRRQTSGTATYNFHENETTVFDYSCYRCKSGNEGAAKITETLESEAKVEGLSNESSYEGTKVEDARVKIVFSDDGTYIVEVEATSKTGYLKETKEKKVEGACSEESEPSDTKSRKLDVPFKVLLGPYKGTPEDKILQQKETKDASNGKEIVTVKIDFTLTRQ
ncbi:MAG TPA: hypothetical protein PKH02_04325 [Bacteroidales bacterium]|nr:hypothetical protein [Bacteroidales bacterium]HPT11111.1 hypothetical protein [Bacteroidales bacterium]